jgi:hypothetical protein
LFRIELFDRWPGFRIEGNRSNYGRLTWGDGPDDQETFVAYAGFRSPSWYRRHWDEALLRVLAGYQVSTLIVNAGRPEERFQEVWDLWLFDSEVILHNRLIVPGGEPLDHAAPWTSAGEYGALNDDGEKISEWRASVSDIDDFMSEGGPVDEKPRHRVWPCCSGYVRRDRTA